MRKLETNKFDAVYKFDWNKPIVFQVSASGSVLSLTNVSFLKLNMSLFAGWAPRRALQRIHSHTTRPGRTRTLFRLRFSRNVLSDALVRGAISVGASHYRHARLRKQARRLVRTRSCHFCGRSCPLDSDRIRLAPLVRLCLAYAFAIICAANVYTPTRRVVKRVAIKCIYLRLLLAFLIMFASKYV